MSETRKWIQVARCEDIPLREGRSVKLGAQEIAIFNLGDRFLAVSNRCPHRNGPLSEGIVSGLTVVCPLHAWKVDLETGAVARPSETGACVEKFRARVENGIVLVEVPVKASSEKELPEGREDCGGPFSVLSPARLQSADSEFGNTNV